MSLDLDAIKARAEAATEGPWRHVETAYGESVEVPDGEEGAQLFIESHGITYAWNGANAEFIAHAREDVPALVAALEAVLAIHHEGVAYADDVDEAIDVPDDYEHHFCHEDGLAWPCPTARAAGVTA